MSVTRSATGRAFAAFLPPDMTRPLVEEDLRAWMGGGQSAADCHSRFEATIAEVRERGLACAAGAAPSPIHQVAVNAFSAPITDADGQMIMALSLTSSAQRLPASWDGPVPRGLLVAAREISARIASDLHPAGRPM
ncbi:MAG: IclR family transcriptional regulator C-terminal domain-containing protein [Pseudorhodoferax sp.]